MIGEVLSNGEMKTPLINVPPFECNLDTNLFYTTQEALTIGCKQLGGQQLGSNI